MPTSDYCIVVEGNAVLSSHTHSGPMAIGGLLTDGTPGESAGVSGNSFVNELASGATFHFDHVTLGQSLGQSGLQYSDYVYLAGMVGESVINTNTHGGQTQEFAAGVWVVDQGGCYSESNEALQYWDMYDFAPGAQANQQHGRRMVVFIGEGTVGIKGTEDNRQFGLSVMAPLAHLVIDETVGYVDGCVVAKSVSMMGSQGSNGAGVQFHCNCYDGPLTCPENRPPPPPCVDTLSNAACQRYLTRGQCSTRQSAMTGCRQTCGWCNGCPTSASDHDMSLHGDACTWPLTTGECALITKEDAIVGSHSHYSGLCIGGLLTDSSPSQHGTVGARSFVTNIGTAAARFQWADGVTTGQPLPFIWSEFETLADNIQPSSSVFVVEQGGDYDGAVVGTYSMDSFFGTINGNQYNSAAASAATGANMLVVFRNRGTVRIVAGAGGRPFMGTILAPRAHVMLGASSSYVDGVVIAKSYTGERGMDQMHAYLYTGPMMCSNHAPPPPAPCVDIRPTSWCQNKLASGRCNRPNVLRNCQNTCGACSNSVTG